MIESDPQQSMRTRGIGKPAVTFALLSVVLLGVVGLASEVAFGVSMPSMVAFAVIAVFGMRGLLHNYPHDDLGTCNCVTFLRAALVAILVGAIFVPTVPWTVFVVGTVAFALDGVDGWLARRAGLSSTFGARFDMEIDALLGAVLALHLLAGGTVGPAILVLGFSRYIFVIAGFIWPALRGDLPDSMRRKTICVIQIAALIALIFPLTPAVLLTPIALVAAAALLYSFAVDAVFLMRQSA
ncbi:MAG: CDP-alcohol phosphatidyltransferase family protein [Sulfitobacter sp.]